VASYITFNRAEDAQNCINCVNGAWLEGKLLRASHGTTKYCAYFLRGEVCNTVDCLYLHEIGVKKDSFTKESMAAGKLSEDFQVLSQTEDLYRYMRLDDINALNEEMGLTRIKIISPDGPSDFMRPVLNAMDEETFELFVKYHLSVCERPDLIGAGSHTLDILRNTK
jgi:hypothetical protein